MFCANEVLMHIDALLKFSPHTIADKSTPIEESTKIYEQVSFVLEKYLHSVENRMSTIMSGK